MRAPAAFAFLVLSATASAAQPLTGTFNGTMDCGQLPFSGRPLSIQATLTISGGTAQFSRTVLHPQTNVPVGSETGQGRIAANGQVTLRTSWRGRQDRIAGSYSGRLTASGGTLSGRQTVGFQGRDYPRSCTITFRR